MPANQHVKGYLGERLAVVEKLGVAIEGDARKIIEESIVEPLPEIIWRPAKAGDARLEFQVHHNAIGHVSIKPGNYLINIRALLADVAGTTWRLSTGQISALSVAFSLARGVAIKFDEYEGAILRAIHSHRAKLNMPSMAFYDLIKAELGDEISAALYASKLIKLKNYGAISLDDDIIEIKESLIRLG